MVAPMSIIRRILRWLGIFVIGVVGLVVVAIAYVYISSERIINRTYAIPGTSIAIPSDSASIAEGQRLAMIRGCYGGCHGAEAEGSVFIDEPLLARLVAPNLTWVVGERSEAELERIVRHGVFPDGRSTLGMPSSMFHLLSDEDLGVILAFLRNLPPSEGPQTAMSVGPLGRLALALGQYTPQAALIDHDAPRPTIDTSDSLAYGRYLALTVCTECHGLDLAGGEDGFTPDLAIAVAYSETAFVRLMRTGKAVGERELNLMSEVARRRFSHFTDAEIRALYGFLKNRASLGTIPGEG